MVSAGAHRAQVVTDLVVVQVVGVLERAEAQALYDCLDRVLAEQGYCMALFDLTQASLPSAESRKWISGWMDIGEARQAGHLLVEAGIVLHRARSQGERAEVDRIVLARQPRVMTHGLWLGQAGQRRGGLAQETGEARQRRAFRSIQIHAALVAGGSQLEDQRFFQRQSAIAAGSECVGSRAVAGARHGVEAARLTEAGERFRSVAHALLAQTTTLG